MNGGFRGEKEKCILRSEVLLKWEKLDWHWKKLNTDGSWDQVKNIAVAGDIIRDADGIWVAGFSCHLGDCSIDLAEMWVIYHGINYAWQNGIRSLKIESDVMNSVLAIKNGVSHNHPLFLLVCSIKEIFGRGWQWSINHIHRQKNMAADFIAKWSCSQDRGLQILQKPPNGIGHILTADMLGVCHPRSVH